jgi:pectin methylesterase-like acyl-CoA thioesterase
MSRSSFSLVYRYLTEGYQDTLDADTGDKLYLEMDIRSAVDFVFGYARAVFLGCRPLVRSSVCGVSKPNVVTA